MSPSVKWQAGKLKVSNTINNSDRMGVMYIYE